MSFPVSGAARIPFPGFLRFPLFAPFPVLIENAPSGAPYQKNLSKE